MEKLIYDYIKTLNINLEVVNTEVKRINLINYYPNISNIDTTKTYNIYLNDEYLCELSYSEDMLYKLEKALNNYFYKLMCDYNVYSLFDKFFIKITNIDNNNIKMNIQNMPKLTKKI